MKKLLVLGATGGTGRQVLTQSMAEGYEVTALVRSADRMPPAARRVRVIVGDVRDARAVREAVQGQDAVVSALGVGNSLKSGGLIAAAAPAIVRAMEQAGVRRLVFTQAYGVGDTYRDTPLIPRLMIAVMLRDLYADKLAGEAVLRRSGLDWTLVYPSTLTNGPWTGKYRAGERLTLGGLPTISRTDLAAFLVNQVPDRTYIRKGVLVSR